MANMTLSQPLPTRHFFVACDSRLPSGQKLSDVPLSREIYRVGVLKRVLKRVRRDKPAAFSVEVRRYR